MISMKMFLSTKISLVFRIMALYVYNEQFISHSVHSEQNSIENIISYIEKKVIN